MARPVKIDNTFLDMDLVPVNEINDDDERIRSLYQLLKTWSNMGDMKDITFVQDVGDPLLYAWRAERKNGRVLNATLLFDSDTDLDPDLTIDLPQPWPLSVIRNGEPTREQLIAIRAGVGIVSFSVTFLLP